MHVCMYIPEGEVVNGGRGHAADELVEVFRRTRHAQAQSLLAPRIVEVRGWVHFEDVDVVAVYCSGCQEKPRRVKPDARNRALQRLLRQYSSLLVYQ